MAAPRFCLQFQKSTVSLPHGKLTSKEAQFVNLLKQENDKISSNAFFPIGMFRGPGPRPFFQEFEKYLQKEVNISLTFGVKSVSDKLEAINTLK